MTVPESAFDYCLKTKEITPLEADVTEYKLYAPGVGQIGDEELKLVKHGFNIDPASARPQAANPPAAMPVEPIARMALSDIGEDPLAEAVWISAINDPNIPADERRNLIEDLNQDGSADPSHVSGDELPLVMSRMALIAELALSSMDEINAAAFAEAYKDLNNIAAQLAP